MALDSANQALTGLVPRSFDQSKLNDLLTSPITDFQALNGLSKLLHNRLIHRLSNGFDVTLSMVVDALNRPGNAPEMSRVVKMFLVSFLFKEKMGAVMSSPLHPSVEVLAAREDDVGTVCSYFLMDEAENGPSTHMHFLRGGLAYKRDEIGAAYDQFDLARQIYARGEPAYHHQLGVRSVRPMAELQSMITQGPQVPRALQFGSDGGFDNDLPILLAAFDPVYHNRYAARLLETGGDRVNFHFHVANPAGAELLSHPAIRYSFEDVADPTPAYYTAMRFLHLEEMLRHYDRPILTIDADAVIAEGPQSLFDNSSDHDVIVCNIDNFRSIVPWRHVIAQLLLCRPTDAACSYLRAFRAQFDGIVQQDGRPSWWIDQALLASSIHALSLTDSDIRISGGANGQSSGVRQSKIKQ